MKIKSYSYSHGIKNFAPMVQSYSQISTFAVDEPDVIYLPTKQMKGPVPKVVVSKGDEVKIGTRVAVSGNNVICSSVSGLVEDVVTLPSVYGGTNEVVIISNNHKRDKEEFKTITDESSVEEIVSCLNSASIVDFDGETVFDKINSLNKAADKTLIINLMADEPFVLSTSMLLSERVEECVNAIRLMAKILNTQNIVIAIKKEELKLHMELINLITSSGFDLNVVAATIPNRYPVGDEVQLIQTIAKKNFNSIKETRAAGFAVFDICAIYAVNKLVVDGEIMTARPLSIIEKNDNIIKTTGAWITIGSTIKDVLDALYLNGVQGIRKIVAGGPMRGIALGNELSSTTFSLNAIMAIKDKITDCKNELPCITCGKCVKVCPVNITPYEIDECTINKDFNHAVRLGANKCIKCGCCSYVCPSKRYLTQRIYYAKEIINDKGLNNE